MMEITSSGFNKWIKLFSVLKKKRIAKTAIATIAKMKNSYMH
jgi:hypothetical protein